MDRRPTPTPAPRDVAKMTPAHAGFSAGVRDLTTRYPMRIGDNSVTISAAIIGRSSGIKPHRSEILSPERVRAPGRTPYSPGVWRNCRGLTDGAHDPPGASVRRRTALPE